MKNGTSPLMQLLIVVRIGLVPFVSVNHTFLSPCNKMSPEFNEISSCINRNCVLVRMLIWRSVFNLCSVRLFFVFFFLQRTSKRMTQKEKIKVESSTEHYKIQFMFYICNGNIYINHTCESFR